MEPLDGNAIGGLLFSLTGTDQTDVTVICAHCRTSGLLAECVVFRGGPGTVVRCRSCGGQLMVFVQRRDIICVDLLGVE